MISGGVTAGSSASARRGGGPWLRDTLLASHALHQEPSRRPYTAPWLPAEKDDAIDQSSEVVAALDDFNNRLSIPR
jgi:hypothetical protein